MLVAVLQLHNLNGHLYSLSIVFHMHRAFTNLEKRLHAKFDDRFGGNAPLPPPGGAVWPKALGTLKDLFRTDWCADDKAGVEPLGPTEFWRLFVEAGDLFAANLRHRCSDDGSCGPARCEGDVQKRERGWAKIHNLWFVGRAPEFRSGRWRELVPALVFWAQFVCLLGPLLVETIQTIKLADSNDDLEQKMGQRLKKSAAFLEQDLTAFRFVLVLIVTKYCESVVCTLFYLSESTKGRQSHHRGAHVGPDGKSEVGTGLIVMRAIRDLLHTLYEHWKGLDASNPHSKFFVATYFWPADHSIQ